MSRTIQIRNVPEDVYAGLVARAGEQNITVPELLRREAERLARTPSMLSWLDEIRRLGRRSTPTSAVDDLDDLRGEWPGADR